MRSNGLALIFTISLGLAGCIPPITAPYIEQPQLLKAALHGNQVCGQFNITDYQYNFDCQSNPLPTKAITGWVLTPLDSYDIPPQGTRSGWNDVFTLSVQTPSLTSIQIRYVPTAATGWILAQEPPKVAPGSYRVEPLVQSRAALWVNAVDDGTNKVWTITGRTSPCQEATPLEIRTTSSQGNLTQPLQVVILRKPAETDCNEPAFGATGMGWYSSTNIGPSSQTAIATPSACNVQSYSYCQHCVANLPETRTIDACSEQEARIDLGYIYRNGALTPIGQTCNPTPGRCP